MALAVAAVLAIVGANVLAPRVGVASPLLLVVGIGVSLLSFVPDVEVQPELILGVVLPPVLYSGAVNLIPRVGCRAVRTPGARGRSATRGPRLPGCRGVRLA